MDYLSTETKGLPNALQGITLEYLRSQEVAEAYECYFSLGDKILKWNLLFPGDHPPRRYLSTSVTSDEVRDAMISNLRGLDILHEGKINDLLEEVAEGGLLQVVKYLQNLL